MLQSVFLSGNPWRITTLLAMENSRFLIQFFADHLSRIAQMTSKAESQLEDISECATGKSTFRLLALLTFIRGSDLVLMKARELWRGASGNCGNNGNIPAKQLL